MCLKAIMWPLGAVVKCTNQCDNQSPPSNPGDSDTTGNPPSDLEDSNTL